MVAAQGDVLVQCIELAVGFRQRRLGLADFELGADTTGQTPLRQIENLRLLGQGRLDDVALGIVQRQLDVGADDVVLQLEPSLTLFGGAHVRQIHGALAGIALAAPEVEGITQAQRRIVVPGVGTGQFAGTIELIRGPFMTLEGRIAVDLHRLGRFGQAGHGPGLAHPGSGHGQARAALQGLVKPPPAGRRPMRVASGALDRFVGGQGIGGERLALGGNTSGSDAAADCQG